MVRRDMDTVLPNPGHGFTWWVVESERRNAGTDARFRVFEAVIGQSEDDARHYSALSDARLDAALMASAVRRGAIVGKDDWTPVSTHVRFLAVTPVRTREDIAALDPVLLDMLVEHEFFSDDFANDPTTVIGGGTYPA